MRRLGLWAISLVCCLAIGYALARHFWVSDNSHVHLVGQFRWTNPGDEHFGGFSGIEFSDDGASFAAISDRAWLYDGVVERMDGAITAVRTRRIRRLFSHMDVPMDTINTDAEGLAEARDGRVFLTSEGRHSVYRIEPDKEIAWWIPTGDAFTHLAHSKGLEALALDSRGRLVALAEDPGDGADLRAYRYERQEWHVAFELPRSGDYVPVGADFGPDGWLYVLERRFIRAFGISSQIRRFLVEGDEVVASQTLLRTRFGRFGNLEGLSVRAAPQGVIMSAISDNNFLAPLVQTWIVEFMLSDGG